MRNFTRLLATVGVVAAITILAGSAAFAHDSHRLSMVKNCATWQTTATCVVTSSNPLGFLVGSVITYLTPGTLETPGGTDVIIETADGESSAPGHCQFDSTVNAGLCTFTSGSGELSGFAARLNVAYLGGPDFSLIGTYRFDSDNDDQTDDQDDD